MRVALLSPYHGGSHRSWADGLRAHSRHRIEVHSLPARFWKWRMHGAALTLARELSQAPVPDAIVATDMLDLSTLLALTRRMTAAVPTLLYMHENQLTYPLPADGRRGPMRRQAGERDRHYGFVNLASMLAADLVVFNSSYHRDSLLAELPRFLRHFPEHRELGAVDHVAGRSRVLPVGIDAAAIAAARPAPDATGRPPTILWNQRWEFDKSPGEFFAALERLAATGRDFRVAVCGERFSRAPRVFERGLAGLGERVVHVGFLDRPAYLRQLRHADIVVSTAAHEFFGISILEAVCAGALPVLPRRLAYPELLPESAHPECLYDDDAGLDRLLLRAVDDRQRRAALSRQLSARVAASFAWPELIHRYDRTLEELPP